MKLIKIASALALGVALVGGGVGSALADIPANSPVWAMDVNKDKKISKEEFLAYQAKMFDKTAGSKGYCTYEEIQPFFEFKNPA
ncbi:MAG: hypothetical protein CVU20_03270 [Betaproteobacteria bacterium HGW-Betaproteobacteria-14]|nr:MAG: hypothetical protein CVU20_03270 [Betaproteobacteria bacterium HGW-Betaproteobacteria-14]